MPKSIQAPGPFLALMLEKYKLNPFKLSKEIQLSQSAVRLITLGKTRISVPVALRLAKYFNTNPEYWLTLQMRYDLEEAEKDKALMSVIRGITQAKKGAAAKEKAPAKKPAAGKKAAAGKVTATAGKRGRKPAAAKAPAAKAGAKTAAKAPRAAAAKTAVKAPKAPKVPKVAVVKSAEKNPQE